MKKLFLLPVLVLVLSPHLRAERFSYKHTPGDKYRILSAVHEEVYVNRMLSHKSEILNRIAVTVGEEEAGMSRHEAVFQTAERSLESNPLSGLVPGRSFQWEREYNSVFRRDKQGHLAIDNQYFMPVVRDVPVFPDRDLKVGDTWTAPGHEAHDFRDSFGIREPYKIPLTAQYTYLGQRIWRGKSYPAVNVRYEIASTPKAVPGKTYPTRIEGKSDQILYWDHNLGQAVAYEETFRMAFRLSNGELFEFEGRAEAEIVESAVMDKDALAEEIAGDIRALGIEDAEVRVVDEGIAISLENIQFQGNSAALLPAEREKLDKIAGILRRYADRDILVGGHTALAGTEEGRRQLSTERAGAVADYLVGKGVRGPDRVVVQGYGADRPLQPNDTEEGRRRNRRVEITILEN